MQTPPPKISIPEMLWQQCKPSPCLPVPLSSAAQQPTASSISNTHGEHGFGGAPHLSREMPPKEKDLPAIFKPSIPPDRTNPTFHQAHAFSSLFTYEGLENVVVFPKYLNKRTSSEEASRQRWQCRGADELSQPAVAAWGHFSCLPYGCLRKQLLPGHFALLGHREASR